MTTLAPRGPTTVHLVRHASHALLPHTLAGRMDGVALSDKGMAEAVQLADSFAWPIAAVISSPMQRALETAAPIAASLGLAVQTDPGFNEIDFGTWTGQLLADLEPDPAWHAWNRLRALASTPGGETMHQAQSRALHALDHLRNTHADQAIVIVSHADIVKALLAPALGLPLDRLYRLTIAPASISTLILHDEDWIIDRINA